MLVPVGCGGGLHHGLHTLLRPLDHRPVTRPTSSHLPLVGGGTRTVATSWLMHTRPEQAIVPAVTGPPVRPDSVESYASEPYHPACYRLWSTSLEPGPLRSNQERLYVRSAPACMFPCFHATCTPHQKRISLWLQYT